MTGSLLLPRIVLRLAAIKADIYTQIDTVKDELLLKISEFRRDFAIHQTEYQGKKEATQIQISSIKNESLLEISSIKNETLLEINEFKHSFEIHKTEYDGKKESYDYRFHANDELLRHKFQRCWDEIKKHEALLDEQKISLVNTNNELKIIQSKIKSISKIENQIQDIQGFLQKHDFSIRNKSE